MDFTDAPEDREFREEARAWLAEHAPKHEVPDASRQGNLDTSEEFERWQAWQLEKVQGGWTGIHWPEACGGRGLSRLHTVLYELEETPYDVPRGSYLNVGHAFAAPTIMAYGSPEIQARLLPKILSGEEFWCQLFSEPAAGSDLAGIRTRAERDGDDWIVNGQKVWTTYAQWAQWAILVTRHDPDVAKHKGLTYFYVDMNTPGIEVRPIRQISGQAHFNEVFLTNVRIPDSQRLGEVGEGWQVALTTLMNERLGSSFSADSPGFSHLFALLQQIELPEGPALDDRSTRDQVADWYVESRGLELIRSRTITRLTQGQQPGPEASVSKIVAASKQQAIASFAIDLYGQASVQATPEVSESLLKVFFDGYLDSPGNRIAGGTDEVLRGVLAERVLGLPGDVRVDRDRPFRDIPSGG